MTVKTIAVASAAAGGDTLRSIAESFEADGAAYRHLADVQRRLLRPPLQPAEQNQRREHQLPESRLGLPRESRGAWRRSDQGDARPGD